MKRLYDIHKWNPFYDYPTDIWTIIVKQCGLNCSYLTVCKKWLTLLQPVDRDQLIKEWMTRILNNSLATPIYYDITSTESIESIIKIIDKGFLDYNVCLLFRHLYGSDMIPDIELYRSIQRFYYINRIIYNDYCFTVSEHLILLSNKKKTFIIPYESYKGSLTHKEGKNITKKTYFTSVYIYGFNKLPHHKPHDLILSKKVIYKPSITLDKGTVLGAYHVFETMGWSGEIPLHRLAELLNSKYSSLKWLASYLFNHLDTLCHS